MTPTRLRRSPASLSRRVGDEVYLASPDRDGYDLLGGSAASIWMHLDRDASPQEVVASLAAQYGVAESSIEAEIRTFLEELELRGWITSWEA